MKVNSHRARTPDSNSKNAVSFSSARTSAIPKRRKAFHRFLHTFTKSAHAKIKRGFDLTSDALRFGRLWYDTRDHAIGYAMHSSRSHDAVIRVYDAADNAICNPDKGRDASRR